MVNNLQIIGKSKWICDQNLNSEIFCDFISHYIPNGLNTNRFKSLNKYLSRDVFDFRSDVPIILFLVDIVDSNRKGIRLLYQTVNLVKYESLYFKTNDGRFNS
jgi:hypothetical protein